MLAVALLLAATPTAPITISTVGGGLLGAEVAAPGAASRCELVRKTSPCVLTATAGPTQLVIQDQHNRYRYSLDLPDGGAHVLVTSDSFFRGEAAGNSIASTVMGAGLLALGFAVHSTVIKVIGGAFGGIGVAGGLIVIFSRAGAPAVAASDTEHKPIAVKALGVAGTF